MWFQLNTTFSTHLGALSTLQSNYGVTYSLSNFTKTTAPDMVEKDKSLTVVLTMVEGATFTSATMTDGTTSITGTLASDSTVTMTIAQVKGPVTVIARAVNANGDGDVEEEEPETPVNPTPGSTMTLKAYFDSVNAPTTVYKIASGTISWVGGENYRHCIIPLSSGISHVKIATGTEASGVAGLLYLSSGAITSDSIVEAVYGTNTTFIQHSTFRGLDTDISAPTGATHIAIGEFIKKETIGCTDADLILTFGSGGGGSTDDPVDGQNDTSTFMTSVGTIEDTYKYDGTNLTMVGSSTSKQHYRHVIVPVADYNITHLCCLTGNSTNNIGPVLFLSGSELKAENVISSKLGTISDSSIVLNSSFRLFDENITIPSGCTHMAWIDYQPIADLLDTSKCNYTITYN